MHCCIPERRVLHDRAVCALWHSPQHRLSMGAPLHRGRAGRAEGKPPCPAPLPPSHVTGGRGSPPGGRAHPHRGPRKILPYLAWRRPALALPAPSTAGELFRRAGLSHARKHRRGHRHPGAIPLQAEVPNAVWTADFKGQFRTGDGRYCYPLTVADAYSRFLLSCATRLSTKPVEARPIFERLFQEYGLPETIRPDNGAPFATPAFCGLSKLSVWWITLGIRDQRIAPGRPE